MAISRLICQLSLLPIQSLNVYVRVKVKRIDLYGSMKGTKLKEQL